MVLDFILKFLPPDSGSIPNKFTIGMGELIKQARKEAGLSQKELAESAYFSQANLSKVENGKVEVGSSELIYLSSVLRKPITYFFPKQLIRHLNPDSQFPDELMDELFLVAKRLNDADLTKIIAQVRAIVKLTE